MSYFRSMDELKVSFVRWLLKSEEISELLVDKLANANYFCDAMMGIATNAAEEAINNYDSNRPSITAEDVDDLERYIGDCFDDRVRDGMLRYDACYPASERDSYQIDSMDLGMRDVTLLTQHHSHWHPTEGRWRSFTWSVVTCDLVP